MNRSYLVALSTLPLWFAACREPKVASYQVPREPTATASAMEAPAATAPAMVSVPAAAPAAAPAGAPMASTPVATASGSGLGWTAPAHWKAKPAQAMRKGTYGLPGDNGKEAELSITAFPGDVGGELANVNRWRGQIFLEPITAADLGKSLVRLEKNGLKMAVFDAVNPGASPERILGAMIPFQGSTWFFKVSGPSAVIEKEKQAFLTFLESVKGS